MPRIEFCPCVPLETPLATICISHCTCWPCCLQSLSPLLRGGRQHREHNRSPPCKAARAVVVTLSPAAGRAPAPTAPLSKLSLGFPRPCAAWFHPAPSLHTHPIRVGFYLCPRGLCCLGQHPRRAKATHTWVLHCIIPSAALPARLGTPPPTNPNGQWELHRSTSLRLQPGFSGTLLASAASSTSKV